MKREIKFRGKTPQGKWQYGDLQQWNDGAVRIAVNNEYWDDDGIQSSDYLTILDVKPDTVGQYTGFHDKNGKEIYEGDIVRWDDDLICYVDWHKHLCKFYFSFGEEQKINDSKIDIFNMNRMGYYYEVIGNIYDNLNLLQQIKGGEV